MVLVTYNNYYIGAVDMSQLLVDNYNLQELNVGGNSICDDGVSAIVQQLQHNITLTKLYITRCGLSVKGIVRKT